MSVRVPLTRSTPEEQGVPTSALLAFLDAAGGTLNDLHSLMVLRHGAVIAEGWWAPYSAGRPHMLFSLSKSFTATAVGFAIADSLLSLDDRVVDLLPDDAPAEVDANLGAMTVRHLLTMTTGHAEDTMATLTREEDNWAVSILATPVEHVPGSTFVYNSGATYLLAAILLELTGEDLLDYLTPRLLDPLGIEGATWEHCPRGIASGGWGLSLATEDIALFGQLYLQRGQWNGVQVVPAAWIDASTAAQVVNGDFPVGDDHGHGYGYQFWRCQHGAYRADGAFGQMCIVMPDQDAVVVFTSSLPDTQLAREAVWTHLLPALSGTGSREADAPAVASLHAALGGLELPTPRGRDHTAAAARTAGIRYRFAEPPAGIESVTLEGDELTIELDGEAQRIRLGFDAWTLGTSPFADSLVTHGLSSPVAASGAWIADSTFVARVQYLEKPFALQFELVFDGGEGGARRPDTVTLTVTQNVSFDETLIARGIGVR